MPQAPSELQREAAHSIVRRYLDVRAGEDVVVESWDHTMAMASAMVDEVRRAGGKALLIHQDEDAWRRAIDRKQYKLLGESSAPEWAATKAADVWVMFWGPGDTDRIEQLPEKTFDKTVAWNWPWYEVARKAGLRGVRMTEGFVTEGRARKWGLDRERWQESVLRASLLNPKELAKTGARLAKALSRGKKVRIAHPNGTDLEVALAGIRPRLLDGRPHPGDKRFGPYGMLASVPAGSITCALDSQTAEGSFRANRRTNIWWTWHSGGRLEFTEGRLTSCSLEEGGEGFSREYERGTTGKDRASALAFGLNPAAKDVPLLEQVEEGSVSLTIGGNRGLGGTNRSNFFTWFSLADAEVSIDGTPIVRDGRILP